MDTILGVLKSIQEKLGMDANDFYAAFIPLIIALITALFNSLCLIGKFIISIFKSEHNKLINVQIKKEGDFFYIVIMGVEILMVFLALILCHVILSVLGFIIIYFKLSISYDIAKIIMLCVKFAIEIISIRVLSRWTYIRKRVLGMGRKRYLIYAPLCILYIITTLSFVGVYYDWLSFMLFWTFLLCEVLGICIFRGRYTKYAYSNISIYLKNNEKIVCNDIRNMRIKKDFVIITQNERQIRIDNDVIIKVEYYGKPDFVLQGKGGDAVYKNIKKKVSS